MEVKRCARCGSFLTSYDTICISCSNKDKSEIQSLKNYFDQNNGSYTLKELSIHTGITEKNLNRYMSNEDFSPYVSPTGNDIGNISIHL